MWRFGRNVVTLVQKSTTAVAQLKSQFTFNPKKKSHFRREVLVYTLSNALFY